MHIIPMTEEEINDHKVAIWLEKFGPSDNVRSMRHGDQSEAINLSIWGKSVQKIATYINVENQDAAEFQIQ